MATSQYLPFATSSTANTLAPSAWAALTTLLANGFQPGVASSEQFNTLARQLSVAASGTAAFAVGQGQDMPDDGNPTTFAAGLLAAVAAVAAQQAVATARAQLTPPGLLAYFWANTPPEGWLEAAGQEVPQATYPHLYARLAGLVPTPTPTTFRLPDLRGLVLRGWDHSRGLDPSRPNLTQQDDAMQRILGTFGVDDRVWGQLGDVAGNAFYALPETAGADTTAEGGDGRHLMAQLDSARVTRTATETRMKNMSALVCIKY